jgi:hypothetical protein
MWNCIRECLRKQPWLWWIAAALVMAIIAGVSAATGGLVFLGLAVITSAIVAAVAVFGVTLALPVVGCIANCFVRGSR